MNHGMSVSMKLQGYKELQNLLKELPVRVSKMGLRKALNAAADPIVKDAKALAPRQSGLLRRSIWRKTIVYKSGNAAVVIGAYDKTRGTYKGKKRVPIRYLHLVEKGHGGPHPAPAHPFLRPAFEANKDKCMEIAAEKLKEVIEQEAAKLAKV